MSKIKLPHASGNSMSIGAPATNPASDLELKLPATIGAAGEVLKNSSTPGTLEFAPAAAIINISPLTYESSADGVIVNNTTSNVGSLCSITRKSTSSNFIIYMNLVLFRPSNTGWSYLGYRRQVNSDTQTGDQEMVKIADEDNNTSCSGIWLDTTTGSVGDVVKIQPRGTESHSQNTQFRWFKTIIFEYEP